MNLQYMLVDVANARLVKRMLCGKQDGKLLVGLIVTCSKDSQKIFKKVD